MTRPSAHARRAPGPADTVSGVGPAGGSAAAVELVPSREETMTGPDRITVSEIADLLGVRSATVHQWRFRSERGELEVPFPEPKDKIGIHPRFSRREVIRWAKRTGRWEEDEE